MPQRERERESTSDVIHCLCCKERESTSEVIHCLCCKERDIVNINSKSLSMLQEKESQQ